MIGSKKKQELPAFEQPPKPQESQKEPETSMAEAKILNEEKTKLLQFITADYSDFYKGIFASEDMPSIDIEATNLNLSFAIYGELRLIRLMMEQLKK